MINKAGLNWIKSFSLLLFVMCFMAVSVSLSILQMTVCFLLAVSNGGFMAYFTLLIKQGNSFSPEFGDYSRETVEGEIDSLMGSYNLDEDRFYLKRDFKIIKTTGKQSAIDAKVAEINSKLKA